MDELGAAVGDRAFVRLPVHWLEAPVLLGCWYAGLEVVTDPAAAGVAFGDAARWCRAGPASPQRLDGRLRRLAAQHGPAGGRAGGNVGLRQRGTSDAGQLAERASPGRSDVPALAGASRAELAQAAGQAAAELGLDAGGRLLWTQPWHGLAAARLAQ